MTRLTIIIGICGFAAEDFKNKFSKKIQKPHIVLKFVTKQSIRLEDTSKLLKFSFYMSRFRKDFGDPSGENFLSKCRKHLGNTTTSLNGSHCDIAKTSAP